jgi:predicted metalloprotease
MCVRDREREKEREGGREGGREREREVVRRSVFVCLREREGLLVKLDVLQQGRKLVLF